MIQEQAMYRSKMVENPGSHSRDRITRSQPSQGLDCGTLYSPVESCLILSVYGFNSGSDQVCQSWIPFLHKSSVTPSAQSCGVMKSAGVQRIIQTGAHFPWLSTTETPGGQRKPSASPIKWPCSRTHRGEPRAQQNTTSEGLLRGNQRKSFRGP